MSRENSISKNFMHAPIYTYLCEYIATYKKPLNDLNYQPNIRTMNLQILWCFSWAHSILKTILLLAIWLCVSGAYHLETSPQQGISVIDSAGSGFYWFGRSDSSSDEDRST